MDRLPVEAGVPRVARRGQQRPPSPQPRGPQLECPPVRTWGAAVRCGALPSRLTGIQGAGQHRGLGRGRETSSPRTSGRGPCSPRGHKMHRFDSWENI